VSPDQRFGGHRPTTRARDLDRDIALVALREALVDGQLSQADFDLRSGAVLGATRVGELMQLTADLQPPPPEAFAELGPQAPRWRRTYGPALIVLGVALGLAGIEGLTQLGGGNGGIEDASAGGGIGFPALDFPGQPAVHTAAGLADLVADVTDEFGTSETLRAVIYPDYVVLWMPQAADPTRVDTFYYDGSFDPPSPAGTRDPATEPLFDLAEVDREALARLVRQAPAAVGVADPQTTYVVVDRRFDVVGALMSVHVSDAYVSGRVEADLDGTVTEVFEAS